MQAPTSHVGIAALREKFDATVAACHTIGIRQLFMPAVPPDQRDSPGPFWSALGAELGALSERFKAHGIALGYHNHNWELREKGGGKTALDLLFDAAAGSPLTWQADVAWLVRGGADPKTLIARYATPGCRRPRQGHRARRTKPRPGRLGRCRRRRPGLARSVARLP